MKRAGFIELLREQLRGELKADDPNPNATLDMLMQGSDDTIRKSVAFTWTQGMRAHYYRQAAAARDAKRGAPGG
jgi:hypothetical protein